MTRFMVVLISVWVVCGLAVFGCQMQSGIQSNPASAVSQTKTRQTQTHALFTENEVSEMIKRLEEETNLPPVVIDQNLSTKIITGPEPDRSTATDVIRSEGYLPGEIQPCKLRRLRLGEIKPSGWLARQLQIQRDGLSGHLDEFWPSVKNSKWWGGDGDAWERGPYWLDGAIPLAWLLDDAELKQRTTEYVEYILTHESEQGWMGPGGDYNGYDMWAFILVYKPLLQYYEVTGDERAIEVMTRNLRKLRGHLDHHPLTNWGKMRWFEGLIPIYELYDITGEQWLLDLALRLEAQGFDWQEYFEHWPWTQPTPHGNWNYMSHVVNNAMAVKQPALWWRFTGDAADKRDLYDMLGKLRRWHGTAWGGFTGDECISGPNPKQGTELCAVVEYMYSLGWAASITGDARFGDLLEKVAYNALPATFSPDMWSHQYVQQVNQVQCTLAKNPVFNTNGPEANIFGLEPNYGCCTANLSQGWPKFVRNMWMRSEDGLAAVAYGPCVVDTQVKDANVRIKVDTDYPFDERIRMVVTVDEPVRFGLDLRIPAWTRNVKLIVSGNKLSVNTRGDFYRINRKWTGTSEVELVLPMQAQGVRRFNNALAIERGPLVYSLKIGEDWQPAPVDKPFNQGKTRYWEIHPTTDWNYALDMNEQDVGKLEFVEHGVGQVPFSPQGAPVSVKVEGIKLDSWQIERGSAADVPPSPVEAKGSLEELTLIPYGCTNIRVTEFPTVK